MDDIFAYGKRPWYAHMKPADVAIWERFIEKYPNAYKSVQYDLHIGDGAVIPPGTDKASADSFTALTQRKIDVVGVTDSEIHIIELKPNADTPALGQVRGYKKLYDKSKLPTLPTIPILITDNTKQDMPELAADMNVRLIIV